MPSRPLRQERNVVETPPWGWLVACAETGSNFFHTGRGNAQIDVRQNRSASSKDGVGAPLETHTLGKSQCDDC
jgi:hypothetical protein